MTGLELALLISFFASAPAAEVTTGTCREMYGKEAKFLANPDESVLIAGVIGWCRNNQKRLLWDERYAAVARKWSEHLVQTGVDPARMLAVDRLRFELRTNGVTDAAVLPYSILGPLETMPPELQTFLDAEVVRGRYTHFAVGVSRTHDNRQMISTLFLGRRPALIDPLPVCPLAGTRLELRLRLLKDFSHPRWLLATPDQKVLAETLIYEEGAWQGNVPLDAGRGVYQFELVVQGPTGPEIAALFPLFVGVEPPSLPTVKLHPAPARYPTPEEAEAAMLALINRTRSGQRLPALSHDPRLSSLAREHSLALLIDRHAVHRTATTGALSDRLRQQGIVFSRALENVALSPSPEAALDRFLESPSHRLNVFDPNVNQLGVGIAMERGAEEDIVAVTTVFIEPPESGDVSAMVQRLHQLINEKRRGRGRFALGLDTDLSRAARQSARRLVDLGPRANPEHEGATLLKELTDGGINIPDARIRYLRIRKLQEALRAPEILDEDVNRLGIGLARVAPEGPGEIWVALVFAGR